VINTVPVKIFDCHSNDCFFVDLAGNPVIESTGVLSLAHIHDVITNNQKARHEAVAIAEKMIAQSIKNELKRTGYSERSEVFCAHMRTHAIDNSKGVF
jgi:glutamyl-tRNA reductase